MSDQQQAPTIRVRIAVAVAEDGHWSAAGWTDESGEMEDAELAGFAKEQLDHNVAVVHFVTANLPLPVGQEVEGRVEG